MVTAALPVRRCPAPGGYPPGVKRRCPVRTCQARFRAPASKRARWFSPTRPWSWTLRSMTRARLAWRPATMPARARAARGTSRSSSASCFRKLRSGASSSTTRARSSVWHAPITRRILIPARRSVFWSTRCIAQAIRCAFTWPCLKYCVWNGEWASMRSWRAPFAASIRIAAPTGNWSRPTADCSIRTSRLSRATKCPNWTSIRRPTGSVQPST